MNAALLIAGRELRDKTRLFITAAALAVIPFLVSVLPTVPQRGDANVVAMVAAMLSFSMALGVASVLGATTIGRELTDGRLSFYFSRPISAPSIWIGKATAGLLAALLSFAIIAVPAMLYSREPWTTMWNGRAGFALITAGLAIVLFFVMHAASTMIRSRSPLLALDFALIVAALMILAALLRPLLTSFAKQLIIGIVEAVAIAIVLVLVVAPLRQLAVGRTDKRRNHAALSKTIWSAVAVILVATAAFIGWVVSVSPSDIDGDLSVGQAPATGWMFVAGHVPARADYSGSFLVGPDGSYRRVPPPWWGAHFSADGKVAAWAQPIGLWQGAKQELYTLDLTRAGAKPVATGVRFSFAEFVLSDDGKRIAIGEGENLSVVDLASGRLLASARAFQPNTQRYVFFVSPDVVRTIQWPRNVRRGGDTVALEIGELDVERKRVAKTGVTEAVQNPYLIASRDGSRLLFRREGLVADGRTGATIARYGKTGGAPMILRDGTVVLASPWNEPARVTIHRPNATPVEVRLPNATYARVRGEIAPGKIAVEGGSYRADARTGAATSLFVIDVATGALERTDRGVRGPLTSWNNVDPRPLAIDTGRSLAALDDQGKLVMWNPRTGERTPVKFGQ